MLISETPENQVSNAQLASALRRQKQQARQTQQPSTQPTAPSRRLRAAGTATQASGRAVQAGGAVTQYGGKAVKVGGRVLGRGGQALSKAGASLSETGVGAIIGVPLAAIGAGATGLSKGMEVMGGVAEKGGQEARQAGQRVSKVGSDIKQRARQAEDLGNSRINTLRSQKAGKRRQGRSLAGNLAGNMGVSDTMEGAIHALSAPVRLATDWALRASWLNIIDSFGLTLIYINIHVFFRFILGTDFFCKLGDEWASGSLTNLAGEGLEKEVMQKDVAKAGAATGVVEALLLMVVDLILLTFIAVFWAVFILIVGALTYPLQFVGQAFGL